MEGFDGDHFAAVGFMRKKRSIVSRRPCSDLQKLLQTNAFFPLSIQPLGLQSNDKDCYFTERMAGLDGGGGENRSKKLKLKLDSVTRTMHTNGGAGHSFYPLQPQEKLPLLDSSFGKDNSLKEGLARGSFYVNDSCKNKPVRRSTRVPKRRIMDIGFNENDDDADDEIHYLASKFAVDFKNKRNPRRILKVSNGGHMNDRVHVYAEHVEEEPTSDDEHGPRSKKLRFVQGRSESIPTTDNQVLHSTKEVLLRSTANPIEFPNGLPPAPSKKQKAKLSEVDLQLKKAEAAQRRRMQSEKAAKEAEAEAIRKILGQESARKKKEEKMKKQHNELAKVKAANSNALGQNTVRWILGPTGTFVIFSDDLGLPKIFNSDPCSYPPPREKCAGPNCSNAYKYWDSKLKLPLCSLHCYKAIHEKMKPLVTCQCHTVNH